MGAGVDGERPYTKSGIREMEGRGMREQEAKETERQRLASE